MIRSVGMAVLALLVDGLSAWAEGTTVQSLLSSGFIIAGVIPSNAGPGIFLQKTDKLFVCFVAETPKSAEVTTLYCKLVH
jgi:hypothetical protein